ncbi:MAG: sodium-translocating pyrophosphatase [Methanomassiliicoccaceae archaeon]|jgi:K(+)-stimulated pyrophosphate-energized sodium pump|nr:sodium-translocating pyrophosphatase [Methanomassiliicoccaceae archaeon]
MIDILNTETLLFMIPVAAVIAMVFALYFYRDIFSKDTGTPEMQKISNAIREGAMAYLARQYKTIGIISVILAAILGIAGALEAFGDSDKWTIALAFLIGAGFSILSGYIGMYISVNANIRTASAARRSLGEAFRCSFRGGAISGIAVATLSLLGVFTLVVLFDAFFGGNMTFTLETIIGYAFGASFAALFAQLGGGIYTKAADVGADLVGKVEAGIPEDDPRNPAVIADLVGDNVGDCAGRGADIFESTAAEIIGAMVIGLAVTKLAPSMGQEWLFFPLVLIAFGLIASLVGIFVVRMKNDETDLYRTLNLGYYVTAILIVASLVFLTWYMLPEDTWYYFLGCGLIGIGLGIAIIYITQYYTAGSHRPVKQIAKASETGPATNVIEGIAMGLETTVMPVIAIILAIIGTYVLGSMAGVGPQEEFMFGIYGTAVGTIAMLASSAFILAEDTFGPITDNAGGIAEMSNQPKEVRNRTDKLDSAGNTTKALTKGYAMGSAALAAFLLFAAYFEIVAIKQSQKTGVDVSLYDIFIGHGVNIGNPVIFVGALLGGMLVFFFAALAIRAVGTAAGAMIENVRTQFRNNPGIMEGTSEPDYAQCVDIATRGALKAMVLPALLPILVPVTFGLLYRFAFPEHAPYAVGALIMVGTIVGILMANFLNNGGGAWDNAKKYIEEGNHGGKGSPTHAAAVVGDTIGDPFKDTAGPSIHVLVKLLATISLVTAVLFIA